MTKGEAMSGTGSEGRAAGMSENAGPSIHAAGADPRELILNSALKEFAAEGLGGARMERIAAGAGVSKPALFYYFGKKEELYVEVVERAIAQIRDSSLAVFLKETDSPGKKLLRSALIHFDRILGQREFQTLVQQEMMRAHAGEPSMADVIVKKAFVPMTTIYEALVREGVASGELVPVDWQQIHLSSLGANVFYFMTAPIWQQALNKDPLSKDELQGRRWGLLEFLGWSIFMDREHGLKLASKVFAETPMPEFPAGGIRVAHKTKADSPLRRGE